MRKVVTEFMIGINEIDRMTQIPATRLSKAKDTQIACN